MGWTASAYIDLLFSLLPRGRAWTRSPDSNMYQLFAGLAEELVRIDARVDDLVLERFVQTTTELIDEHELDLGLPDSCTGTVATLVARRAEAYTKLIAFGGQDKPYFIDVAAALGYTITIDEFTPFWCGIGVCGDPIGDQDNLSYWRVNWLYDPLDPKDAADLICRFTQLKPAHTALIFRAIGPGFSSGFNSGFNSLPDRSYSGGFSTGFSLGFNVAHGSGGFSRGFGVGFDTAYGTGGFSKGFSTGFKIARW